MSKDEMTPAEKTEAARRLRAAMEAQHKADIKKRQKEEQEAAAKAAENDKN